jgi:hypothetical protein
MVGTVAPRLLVVLEEKEDNNVTPKDGVLYIYTSHQIGLTWIDDEQLNLV